MHDHPSHQSLNRDDHALTAALRALPADEPPGDAWPLLAARTTRRRRVRRGLWAGVPVALAAGIALAVVWPRAPSPAPTFPGPAVAERAAPAATRQSDLAALRDSSRQWQAWVVQLNAGGAPLDGDALASAVALQDRIALIDLQLSAARNPATAAQLWQQRIVSLQQLGLLHLQPYTVARQLRAAPETTLM